MRANARAAYLNFPTRPYLTGMRNLMLTALVALLPLTLPTPSAHAMHATDHAAGPGFEFDSIDGGTLSLADWHGQPVLVVNTASRCAFTPQYAALQALYDRYKDDGLVVLAVPSDDFRQELDSAEAVKAFCEANFNLDLPMTDITPVTGRTAHPFFAWLAQDHQIRPRWNFHKVLLNRDGQPVASFSSTSRPLSRPVTRAIEQALAAR